MIKWAFYWFFVSLGLNFGFIPEEHTAMTAEEINRSVVQDSGRTDLCVNYATGDYAPTTRALELMNEAQQFLDRLYRNRGSEDCHTIDIAVGDYQIDVPNIRHVTRMDMTAPDGARHELRRRTYPFMREQYGESFDLIDVGQPLDWARAIGETITGSEAVVNGGFDSGSGWNLLLCFIGQGKLYTSGLEFSATSSATMALDAGNHVFSMSIEDDNEGNSVAVALSGDASVSILPTRTNPGTGDIEVAFQVPVAGDYTLTISGDGAGSGLGMIIDDVSIIPSIEADYIFLPPADEAYTMCVYGGYYNTAFESASDISWWSDTYPSILMMAYRMVIERHFHANETRVAYWMKQIALESKQLQIDLVAEETTNPPKYMRRMPSAVARRHLT